jgi:protein phosphatase PTC7
MLEPEMAATEPMQATLDMGAFYHPIHFQLTLSVAGEGTQSCGEDAYFISKRKNMMGISDGVSAWSAYGLGNSGYLAFYLMSNARVAAEKREVADTEKLLNDSFEAVWDLHDNKLVSIPNGSATITTLRLYQDPATKQHYIQYSNLGDCMVLIIRPERLDENIINLRTIHISKKLYSYHEHARGVPVPLQLVFYPAQGRKLSTEQSGGVETSTVPVQAEDIVILATDGLWDNLTNDDVLRIVATQHSTRSKNSQGEVRPFNPTDVAKKLVEEAYRTNLKPDDITTIVGIVRKCL